MGSNQHNAAIDTFLRFTAQRLSELQDAMKQLMPALAGENKADKVAKARVALAAVDALQLALHTQDHPPWMRPLNQALTTYVQNDGRVNVANDLAMHYAGVVSHQWAFDFSDDKAFDFDGLYRRYREQSRIPELFDALVKILEEIVKSEALDSRTVAQSLETIIASLKKNRDGSYFAVLGTWRVLTCVVRNVAWSWLSEGPLKILAKGLRDTLEELDKEMEKLHTGIQGELQQRFRTELPTLAYTPSPLPPPLAIADGSAIDAEFKVVDRPQ